MISSAGAVLPSLPELRRYWLTASRILRCWSVILDWAEGQYANSSKSWINNDNIFLFYSQTLNDMNLTTSTISSWAHIVIASQTHLNKILTLQRKSTTLHIHWQSPALHIHWQKLSFCFSLYRRWCFTYKLSILWSHYYLISCLTWLIFETTRTSSFSG